MIAHKMKPLRWHLGEAGLRESLRGLPVPAWRVYPSVGSSNDAALAWAALGAPDGCFVLAETQTRGRGRGERKWWSHPRASLAFTVIVRPLPEEAKASFLPRFTAWGAVALAEVLAGLGAFPSIKWPNDVLLAGRKVAGALAEAHWEGDRLTALAVGIGVNLAPAAVPPADVVDFPAGCLADALGYPPSRQPFLAALLRRMAWWRYRLARQEFLQAWESRLAYRGRRVCIGQTEGVLLGLNPDGSLRLRLPSGKVSSHYVVSDHLRPVDSMGELL